ncbi:MAG: ATP-binding protein [Cellvibrionaceae bacterium]|nr:ATP-binding protein [Cellvibrionaceae bacterium]
MSITRYFQRSVSRKLMLVVLATTFLALSAYGSVMLIYDLRTYHDSWVKDLTTQANIIAEVSAPALEFDDPQTARENLNLLSTRRSILQAAIYTASGEVFAGYSTSDEHPQPMLPALGEGYLVQGDRIAVVHPIAKNGTSLGTVYILARYEARARLTNYALILVFVMAASMSLALLISIWLQAALTRPLFAVTNVAREVMQRRDFSLRAEKFSEDEIGILVDAFNDMLSEVEKRARALEDSNRSLEHEMTERQAAEHALLQADRRKDEFLATLAHELRNPLAPLLNSLRIMRMADGDTAQRQEAQDIMERQLRQMVRLVDDLLDVSRITTGKLTISTSRVSVRDVMQAAVETCNAFIKKCGHHLDVTFPAEPLCVEGDSVRLSQVFANLLNNSAKYTNVGGHIRFAARRENDQVVVEVSDDGIGIAPEMLPEIFQMFIQVDYSLERAHAGLGVGLALSRRLVELHGGTLVAHSDGIGRGSLFRVALATAECPEPAADKSTNPAGTSASRRVLLVDDNVDFVSSMASLLTLLGHEVKTVNDGVSALTEAANFTPDYAFLDIGMPGLNGYDLARRLREFPATANCVLTAVTGWGQEKDRELSRDAGFDYHLVKPVELARILEVLEAGPRK